MRKQVGEICGVRMVVDDEMPERVWWLTRRGGSKELGIRGMKKCSTLQGPEGAGGGRRGSTCHLH